MILAAALILVRISGASMEPTLQDGQFYHFAQVEQVERGQVALVRLGVRDDTLRVKRIVAVPGDTLRTLHLTPALKGYGKGATVVPQGYYYITADNPAARGWTSRERGLIPRGWIRATLKED